MSQIEELLAIAHADVGYLEKKSNKNLHDKTANAGSGNYTKFWDMLAPTMQGQPWCAAFISWCARQAEIPTDVIPTFYSCDIGMDWFKKRKQFDRVPQRGDIVFFGVPGDSQHVGLVYDVRFNHIYTYEGNTSGGSTMIANGGGVCAKSYAVNYNRILGFGHPKYEEDDDMTEAETKALIAAANKRYNTIGEVPDWGRTAVQKMIDAKAFSDTKALDLSHDMVRAFVLLDRAGKL